MTFFSPTAWQAGKPTHHRLPQCGKCGLFKQCESPKMEPTGDGKRSILFVGEAPGDREDEQGTHFVSKGGQHLRKVLRGLGVDLDDAIKTNALICHPPKMDILDLHITSCRPNLLKTIREVRPRVVVLMGPAAVKSFMPTERDDSAGSIAKWVGWTIPSHEHQAWICPTYSPSYLLRMDGDPVLERMFRAHLKEAIRLERRKVPADTLDKLKAEVEHVHTPREKRLRLKDLARKRGILAFDYEATGLKPEGPGQRLVSVSFCFEGSDTFALMLDDEVMPHVSRVLRKPGLLKVAHNLQMEERWTFNKLGHHVAGWYHCTMNTAHILDNRKEITGLKFQAFVNFGIADYDAAVEQFLKSEDGKPNRIHEIPPAELLTYNGLDSLLGFKLMVKQREVMGL